jgi:hypothetical protein
VESVWPAIISDAAWPGVESELAVFHPFGSVPVVAASAGGLDMVHSGKILKISAEFAAIFDFVYGFSRLL